MPVFAVPLNSSSFSMLKLIMNILEVLFSSRHTDLDVQKLCPLKVHETVVYSCLILADPQSLYSTLRSGMHH